MKLLKAVLLVVLFFSTFSISAQKIKFKKGKILVDGTECFKYETEGGKLVTVYNLTDDEIMSFEYVQVKDYSPNNVAGFNVHFDTYFNEQDVRVNLKFSQRKKLIKSLVKSKVLKDCKLDSKKLKSFINKYSL